MRPFNFAEVRIAERSYCRDNLDHRLRVMAALLALTLAVAMGSWACGAFVSGRVTQVKSDLANVQSRCIGLKREILARQASSSQRKWEAQLAEGSRRWVTILQSVLACVPEDAWLDRVASDGQNYSLEVEGGAPSFASVSGLISNLRSSLEFSDARLSDTRVVGEGRTHVDFTAAIKLRSGSKAGGAAMTSTANTNPSADTTPQAAGVPALKESP